MQTRTITWQIERLRLLCALPVHRRDTVYLDTETTGLYPEYGHKVVEVAVTDDDGQSLLDTLVNPGRPIPSDASSIHGIFDTDVRDAPSLEALLPALVETVQGRPLVIYNANFDLGFLPDLVVQAPSEIHCCMLGFAAYRGQWSDYWRGYRWAKLFEAAAAVGHVWSGAAHRALADTHACRSVWQFLTDPARQAAWREELEHLEEAALNNFADSPAMT